MVINGIMMDLSNYWIIIQINIVKIIINIKIKINKISIKEKKISIIKIKKTLKLMNIKRKIIVF